MTKRSSESDRDLSFRPASEWDRLWADLEPKDARPLWNSARSLRVLEQFSRSALNPRNGLITRDVLEYVLRPFVSSPLLVLCGVGKESSDTWVIPTSASSANEWIQYQCSTPIRLSYAIAQYDAPFLCSYGRHCSYMGFLDIVRGSWHSYNNPIGNLPVNHNLCSVGELVFLCGGERVKLDNYWGNFAVDPAIRSLVVHKNAAGGLSKRQCADMPYSVSRGACVAVDSTTVLVAGGSCEGFRDRADGLSEYQKIVFDGILSYDVHTDRWCTLDNKLSAPQRGRGVTLADKTALLLMSPYRKIPTVFHSIDIRLPSVATLLSPIGHPDDIVKTTLVALDEHCVAMIGGWKYAECLNRTTFIFDIRANRVYEEDRLRLAFANALSGDNTSAVLIRV